MSTDGIEDRSRVLLATRTYEYLLKACGAMLPMLGIWYLVTYQSPVLCAVEHPFHVVAVSASILTACFVTYVTWRCYLYSGEVFLRWVTLGFLGFAVIYAPHGIFTEASTHDMPLFLLFGPASRVAMTVLLFVGLMNYRRDEDSIKERRKSKRWLVWIGVFLAIDLLLALIAETALLKQLNWRIVLEGSALLIALAGLVIVLLRHRSSPLMMTYALALALFVQSSIAFLQAVPWNHLWWYAHLLFAIGFLVLSYGVIRAFHTTGAFSTVYGEEELMHRLRSEKEYTEKVLSQLQAANTELAWMASTDSLTGAANRRRLLEAIDIEIGRAKRNGLPASLLVLDIDHFKEVNDTYGHQIGDQVLRDLVSNVKKALRSHDILGRIGGEEFMVLLPDTPQAAASALAERIRKQVEGMVVTHPQGVLHITVSIGVAEFGRDGEAANQVIKAADDRLYRAKHEGRNRVIS
ncbi:MAG TPA: GGDEF domain-containing protein [Sideroxyarcus sp.]|nr:GGDEF domain-containing protein [Sideroxyarcus sp.]